MQFHFSQEGEDLVLFKLLDGKTKGFYIDVGAHHPQRLSNTYYLYLKGWRGINIDPMPGSKKLFDTIRKEDINLEFGVSANEAELTYYRFEEGLLNTFSKEIKDEYVGMSFEYLESIKVNTYSLNTVLRKYLPSNQQIDLLSIDVEGLDLEVLQSNDWEKFKPSYIIVEDLKCQDLSSVLNSDISNYLKPIGYIPVSKLDHSLIYKLIV